MEYIIHSQTQANTSELKTVFQVTRNQFGDMGNIL